MKNPDQSLLPCERKVELKSKNSKISTNFSYLSRFGKISSYLFGFLTLFLLSPDIALADTGSTELTPVLTFLTDNLNGIVGKIIVVSAVLIALITSVIKFNGYVVAGCVGTALFAFYGDNFLVGLFGALI
jgi:hypothetical protein